VGAWLAKLDADPDAGGLRVDPRFFPNGDDFRGLPSGVLPVAGSSAQVGLG
jgi:hypothetical protein